MSVNKNLKKNDQVRVISGKDKGKISKIIDIDTKKGKVLVENLNIVSRHTKPNMQNDKGGIIKKEAFMDASNVMLICDNCTKTTRVSSAVANGKKVRICKKCGEEITKKVGK